MNKISNYYKLIKELPINEQSTRIKKNVWERIKYKDKDKIEESIFLDFSEIELSRFCVKKETDIRKKIVMVLMWGYPTGGRGNNIQNVLVNLDELVNIFTNYNKKNLNLKDFENLISSFSRISGLGISTWTKFLYFFEISVENKKCEIFDLKIVESLNKKQFVELKDKHWIQDFSNYMEYINLIDEISNKINVQPDQVELFLFYFNLYYKFEK
ncbi:MAG: hypothetical protein MSH22_02625 [Spirochaetia bacterium]|nr:hypothetical protein [Spirochaetia bacterium]